MKIINLIYFNYILSLSISLISCFVIFFIFSLIGYLNEDYLFKTIINVSVLNSLQILISVILLSIFLRSKNEMIIIKSYLSFKKLILFFLPVVLIFTILEINKKNLATFVEDVKTSLIEINSNSLTKILIKKNDITETFTVLKNINGINTDKTEYRFYKIKNNKIIDAQFSDDLVISEDKLIAKKYTEYNENIIKDFNSKKIFDVNFLNLLNFNSIVVDISEKKNFFKMININSCIFAFLLFTLIFLIFFNKKYVNTKQSLSYPILICLLYLIYSFLVLSNSLTMFKQLFEFLACFIISMLILKTHLNE